MSQARASRFTFDWTPRRQRIVRDMMARRERLIDIAAALGISTHTLSRYLDSPAPKGNANGS